MQVIRMNNIINIKIMNLDLIRFFSLIDIFSSFLIDCPKISLIAIILFSASPPSPPVLIKILYELSTKRIFLKKIIFSKQNKDLF